MTRSLSSRLVRPALVLIIAVALAAVAIALAPGSHHGHDTTSAASRESRDTFHDAMRRLLEDHIVWTLMVIVSVDDFGPIRVLTPTSALASRARSQRDSGAGEVGGHRGTT